MQLSATLPPPRDIAWMNSYNLERAHQMRVAKRGTNTE